MFQKSFIAALSLVAASAVIGQSPPEMRMTPLEMNGGSTDGNQIGSSRLPGVHTQVLFGDPSRPGFYSILLFVLPHTTIPAHSYRDERMATVVAGEWLFGCGDHFDANVLKTLPPGSVYSEPDKRNHFARTDADPVIVQIPGYGPTDTRYFDPANEPKSQEEK